MPADTIRAPSAEQVAPSAMPAAHQLWNLPKRLDDLQRGLTAALGVFEDLVRQRISALVAGDDDS